LRIITKRKPDYQKQECNVNPQLNPGDADDWKRPAHAMECVPISHRARADSGGMDIGVLHVISDP
jgi:hypothetical protein